MIYGIILKMLLIVLLNGNFDVTITTIPIVDAKTYKVTTITITPIDELTDNKNTLITTDVLYTDDATGNTLYKTSTIVSDVNTVIPKDSKGLLYK